MADTIRTKKNLSLQIFKPIKDNLSKNERKAFTELQFDTSFVILTAEKRRAIVILNHEDYLERRMDHVNKGPYHLYKKDRTTINQS